jgi:DNA-binding NtrC family response regulator
MSRSKIHDAAFKAEIDDLVDKLLTTRRPWSLRRARRQFERAYTEYMIRRSDDDRHRAAERLDIGFSTLKEKIRKSSKS